MAILRSPNELALALDRALAEKDEKARTLIEWEASWTNRPCFHCGNHIGNDDRAFLWMGHDLALVMHHLCLFDWLIRVMPDAERAVPSNAA